MKEEITTQWNKQHPKQHYFMNEKGQVDVLFESFFKTGGLSIKCGMKDDELHGPYESYFENGRLEKKCFYKNGRPDGPYEARFANGKIAQKGAYFAGDFFEGEEAYQLALAHQKKEKAYQLALIRDQKKRQLLAQKDEKSKPRFKIPTPIKKRSR